MIRFFRKIRLQLFNKNKFSKYILYAIGEIILVVIGILIALGINNWNNEEIAKRRNIDFLNALAEELQLNVERAEYLNNLDFFSIKRKEHCDSILSLIKDGIQLTELKFLTKFDNIYQSHRFNLHAATYEELKNTGSLYSVGSDSLVIAIQEYYRLLDRDEFYNTKWGDDVYKIKHECAAGWRDFSRVYKQDSLLALSSHPWIFNMTSKNFILFRTYVAEASYENGLTNMRLDRIAERSIKLKTLIEKELRKNVK